MPVFISLFMIIALSLTLGCTTTRVLEDTRSPEIVVDASGKITFRDQPLTQGKIAQALRAEGIKLTQEINILLPPDRDLLMMSKIVAELKRAGYSRTVFVTPKKASATTLAK